MISMIMLVTTIVAECVEVQFPCTITRQYGSYPERERWSIYKGSDINDDESLIYDSGIPPNSYSGRTYSYYISLLAHVQYSLVMWNIYNQCWETSSTISINVDITYHFMAKFLNGESMSNGRKIISFKIPQMFSIYTIWKYTNIAQLDNSWLQQDFIDSSWSSGNIDYFQNMYYITRYYRCSLTLTDTTYHVLGLSLRTNTGFIIYVNGKEAIRSGLPSGIISFNTGSLIYETYSMFLDFAIQASPFINTGSSYLFNIEVHLPIPVKSQTDTFSFITRIPPDAGVLVGGGGIYYCRIDNVLNNAQGCASAFDNNMDTKFLYGSTNNTLVYTLPRSMKTWFNGYRFWSGIEMSSRDPKEWILYGTEDNGLTWIFLDHVTNNKFSMRQTNYDYYLLSNRKQFNAIKLEILDNNGAAATEFCEFCLMAYNKAILGPGLHYAAHILEGANFLDVNLAPTSSGMHTYTIDPSLPAGLYIDYYSGVISGSTIIPQNNDTYIISAIDAITNEVSTFPIYITLTVCHQPTMAQVIITKLNKIISLDEHVDIYSEENDLIMSITGSNDNSTQTKILCEPAAGTTATYYINTRLDLDSRTDWKYQQGIVTNSNWKTNSYSDSNWKTFTYYPLLFITQKIVLLRKSFTITSRMNMVGWKLFFKSKAGCVIYLNGNEIYRYNLVSGEINGNSVASGGDITFLWRSVSGPMTSLSTGNSVTVAIALVNIDSSGYNLDFDAMFLLLGDSKVNQDSSNGVYDSSSISYNKKPIYLFDSKYNTNWMTISRYSITEEWATIKFENNNAVYMNKYCIISNYESPQYDPSDWTIYGSMDGITWTSITSQSNVSWEERNQRQCFYAPDSYKAYTNYKISVTKAVGSQSPYRYAFSEWEFFIEDIDSLIIPPLSLTPSYLVAYKGVPVPPLLVSSEYYHNFTISPQLPTGITIDTSNGYLNGIPTTLKSLTTYTIHANNIQGTSVSSYVTLSVISCTFPNNLFRISMYFTNYANEASWTLRDSFGSLVDSRNSSIGYSTQNFIYCRAAGVYSLIMSDSKNDGWGEGTYSIYIEDSTTPILSGSLAYGESPKTVSFSIAVLISGTATWKYFFNSYQAPSDWNQVSFSDITWHTGTSGHLYYSSAITQYYRNTFTLSTLNPDYVGIDIMVKTFAGMVVYLNGHEVRRVNMNSGTLYYNTLATVEYASYIPFTTSISTLISNILVIGKNVLAVEIHKRNNIPNPNAFYSTATFISSGEYRVSDGVAWSDIETNDSEGTSMLFDNKISTRVLSGPRCVGAIYKYTFNNNRKEFINHYKITNANDCNQRHPSGWRIEGSNDNGATWTLLDIQHQQLFTSFRQTYSYDFYSSQAYNSFRFVATECNNPPLDSLICGYGNFQLSEFGLYVTNAPISCASTDIWGPAPNGGYSSKECPIGYTGFKQRLCTNGIFGEEQNFCDAVPPTYLVYSGSPFTCHKNIPVYLSPTVTGVELEYNIVPDLPLGLLINSSTGIISGTPLTNNTLTSYTITATNTAGSVTSSITIEISISFCPSDDIWPITESGKQITLNCTDPINYEGSKSRLCILGYPSIWNDVIDNCQLKLPTISYINNNITGYKNYEITPIIPIITGGNLNPLTIIPSLPDGLIFNTENGEISGIPTNDSSNSYTITISNSRSQDTITLTINIIILFCPSDNIWPKTEIGQQITLLCEDPINYEGFRSRLCILGYPAIWNDVIDTCQLKLPTISYINNVITGYKNHEITPIIATITGGNLNPITISPSLPDGLYFNSTTGEISGIPTVDSSNSYTITISNSRAQDTITLTIIISISFCPSDDIWPITESGKQITLNCTDPINYEGSKSRLCILGYPSIWNDVIDNCQLKLPTISYINNNITGYKNYEITPIIPIITGGNLNPLTIIPSLPDGLIFNTENGEISGIPTNDSSNSYTITISNSRSQDTITLTINIIILFCPSDNIWPKTEIGQQITLLCEDPINYEGFRSRLCILGYPAIWNDVIDTCQLKLPTISYINNVITGYKNHEITPIIATITGGNLNPITISPSLPDGLYFNSTTGEISGIPTVDSSNSYTITISNSRAQDTITLTIIISISFCPSDDIWPITESGKQITLNCTDPINYEGSKSRLCILGYPSIWNDVIDNCQLKLPTISYINNNITGYKNYEITPIIPIITGGNLNPLTIIPSLPDGLIFNTENGEISGIPTNDSSNSYTITISNSRSQDTITLTINIIILFCPSDNIWPKTEIGQQITLLCEDPINYEGFRSRLCILGYPAIWNDVIDTCQLKLPTISYINNVITGYKNHEITPIIATITGGNLNPITISPSLPDGLYFNSTTGEISGIPTVDSSNSYTITISNSRAQDTITLTIIISISFCPSDDIWPITESGKQITLNCTDPINYEGSKSRLCILGYPSIWNDVIDNCQLKLPTISYINNNITGYKNYEITPIIPIITGGNLNPLTIIPSLPDGLIFNTENGEISGIPTNDSSNSYTITISNSRSQDTITLTINIIILFCPSDNIWPKTEIGQQITLLCEDPINYEGFRSRLCILGYPAIWNDVIDTCQLKLPTISYINNVITGYKNHEITPIIATITGGNLNPITISPSLPDGLYFNSTTGEISGIPTVDSSNSYTITISNSRAQDTITLTIIISISFCPSDDIWPITESGKQITLNCTDPINYEGSKSRLCILGYPSIWNDVIDNCQLKLPTISYINNNITGYKNYEITPIIPIITGGNLNPLTIIPSLPDGLIFNTENGEISGIPTNDSSNSYTITISNSRSQDTITLTINIIILFCPSDNIWPKTEIGQQITLLCEDPINYEGFRSRLCILGYPAIWNDVIDTCQLKLPTISYINNVITGYKNHEITPIIATITGGNLNPITISPSLPDGLYFNSTTGEISGIPTVDSSNSYTITISNSRAQDTITLTIIISISFCPSDDIWPITESGKQITLNCTDPINYEGSKSRLCILGYPSIWNDVIDNCQLKLPTISYINNNITGYKNYEITPIIPIITGGNLNPLTIIPSLPDGLIFNTENGEISGIPTNDSSNSYTITISNSRSQDTITLTINIIILFCPSDNIWPKTEIGQQITLLCEDPINYEGFRSRLCILGYPAIWNDVIDTCQLKLPTISYINNVITGYKNHEITPIIATITGGNLNPITISPSLPDGLYFNSTTGEISGIPTVDSSNSYTITISNSRAQDTITLTIIISISFCPSDDIWPITESGKQITLNCTDPINYEGSKSRLCILGYPSIWNDVIDNCQLKLPTISYINNNITGYKNYEITPIIPIITGGNLNPLTIIPSLPDGLIFNTENGEISGIPTNDSSNSYTITISNSRSQDTITLTINIIILFCPSDNIWPKTEIGQQITLLCEDPINYEGFRSRLCILGYPAIWNDVIDTCQLKLPTISYINNVITGYKNHEITPIIATITGGNLNPITISPSLPDGLYFNSTTGEISGIPTVDSSNSYTITISNSRAQDTITLTIIISISFCPSDDIWPITESGKQITLNCTDPINYEGSKSRLCILGYPSIWNDVIDNCQLKLPTISYINNNITGYKNYEITPIIPIITGGNLNPLTIIPSLPDGLIFNTENGEISGIPTNDSSNSYTITISNSRSQDTITLTINIIILFCPSDNIWPKTEIGQQITLLCEDPINYEGFRSRLCILGYPAIWNDVIDTCQLKLPTISYINNVITGYKNHEITPIIATITGGNLNPITISPSLPDGLYFNSTTGEISGIPTVDSSNSYTITISNSRAQDTITLTIIISISFCPSDDIWPITESGKQITLNCTDPINYEGSKSRLCILGYPSIWNDVIDNCQLKLPTISYINNNITGYKNYEITPIIPIITGGNLNPLTIIPSLPDGLIFNTENGEISGIPTNDSSNSYTITISNSRSQDTITLTINIIILFCPSDNIWPKTEIGQQITLLCEDPINYEGFRSRLCILGYPAIWNDVIDTCQLKLPTISYINNVITGYKNHEITPIIATITGGNLNPITISPSLPDGLYFNSTTGEISGIPTVDSSNSYTITISNSRAQDTITLTIIISISFCPSDDIWPITESGKQITLNCTDPINYEGSKSRLCILGYPSIWNDVIDNCQLKLPTISYINNNITGYKNYEITPIIPIITGGNLNPLTIIPSLPDGLIFNTENGEISGIPTNDSSNSYTITISNSRSQDTITLTINIIILFCPSDNIWPKTELFTIAYYRCPKGQSGVQTRLCKNSGYNTADWGIIDTSNCFIYDANEDPKNDTSFIYIPLKLDDITETAFNTPSTYESFRNLIVQYVATYSIASRDIIIINVHTISGTYSSGIMLTIRITVKDVNRTIVKQDIISFINDPDKSLINDCIMSSDFNLKTITSISIDGEIKIRGDSTLLGFNLFLYVVIILALIISPVSIIITIACCFLFNCLKKKLPKKRKISQVHQHENTSENNIPEHNLKV
ncbi:hypothetical protein WA158_002666 [Blastocystis sp. Blastoise]